MRVSGMKHASVLLVAFLAACSSLPVHETLPAAARDQLTSTDIVAPVPQSEIYVFVAPTTGAAGFGLIGALVDISIDSARTSKAEAAVTTLRNALVDYNFDQTFKAKLVTTLGQVPWLHAGNASVIKDVTADSLDKSYTASGASAVLFVASDYHLNNDANAIQVTLGTWLVPRSTALLALRTGKADAKHFSSRANALYRNTLVFEAQIGDTKTRDGNIAKWSANNGHTARLALDMALDKLTALLVADIQRAESDKAPPAGAPQTTTTPPSEAAICNIAQIDAQCATTGVIDSTDADGQITRFGDGSIRYVKQAPFE